MSTDTIYQQLRGHLHYLKLTAIAEQLATALQQARRASRRLFVHSRAPAASDRQPISADSSRRSSMKSPPRVPRPSSSAAKS